MVNYQVTVPLDKLLSNDLAILSANYYYIHMVCVCASRNKSDQTVHMHRQIKFFLLFIYSISGNFS